MSLRSSIQPRVTSLLTSPSTRDVRRKVSESIRKLTGRRHIVHYFHQVDDPYSHLAAQLLEPLLERFDIELEIHLVGPPPDSAAPERERLVAYSRVDAQRIAEARGLAYRDGACQPAPELVNAATRVLATATSPRSFASLAPRAGEALWDGDAEALEALEIDQYVDPGFDIAPVLARGDALRAKLGHYLGAVFHYAGESYWGVDRLGYLESRLASLGVQRKAASQLLAPRLEIGREAIDASSAGLTLETFLSLRSPYSYIAIPRTLELVARTGVALKLRPVLPMVMRGLAVPASKRMYITLDTKREAESVGLPFGRICDPVGKPVERGFSLFGYAREKGRGAEYLLSFGRAAFAEGIDTGTDGGLRHVVAAAGLDWEDASRNFDQDGWRQELEENRQEMLSLGLWGVPSYRLVGPGGYEFATWGQDRLWLVENEIRKNAAPN
jgi:2-hydroxychromene-2-carboxylate isomerase